MSDTRQETLTRLMGCGCVPPSPPPSFPSNVMPLSVFEDLMYRVAYSGGNKNRIWRGSSKLFK